MKKNWQIPRRTFLRGLGAVVALPMLEAMAPAGKLFADTVAAGAPAAAGTIPKRLAFIYIPNGCNMAKWMPDKDGTDYELSPTLAPLASHKGDFNLLSGLTHKNAFGMGDGGGDHARASATYLTGKHPKKSASDIHAGISVDQVAANQIGDQTRLPSLELSCDRGQEAGSCDSGYSCAYQFNISWRSETQPMNPEIEPKQAFERLFGGGTTEAERQARAKRDHYDQSILDVVQDQARTLQTRRHDRPPQTRRVFHLHPRRRTAHPAKRHRPPGRPGRRDGRPERGLHLRAPDEADV